MESKDANPNGCTVVINNIHLMFLFFFKNIENWVNKRTSKFILEYRIYNCSQTKTLHNFWLIGMLQGFLYIYKSRKPISSFYFWRKWFFQICPDYPSWKTNYILGHNFWLIYLNVLEFSAHERYSFY